MLSIFGVSPYFYEYNFLMVVMFIDEIFSPYYLPTKHTYSLNKKLKNVFLKNEVKSYKNAKDLFLIRQKTHDILQPYNMHYITEHSVIFEVIKAL